MTKVKEQAIGLLQSIPDDKVVYIIDILHRLNGLSDYDAEEFARTFKEAHVNSVTVFAISALSFNVYRSIALASTINMLIPRRLAPSFFFQWY